MDQQRSAVDRIEDLKRQLAQARDRHIAGAPSEPAVLYSDGQRQPLPAAPRRLTGAKVSPREQRRRDREVVDGNHRDQVIRPLVFELVSSVLRDFPAATLPDVQRTLRAVWPARRGSSVPKALKPSPKQVKDLHDALISEDPKGQNCKTACEKLADVLNWSTRKVEQFLEEARRNK